MTQLKEYWVYVTRTAMYRVYVSAADADAAEKKVEDMLEEASITEIGELHDSETCVDFADHLLTE